MLDELCNAAVVLELGLLRFTRLLVRSALVGQRDQQALVKERHLAQALRQGVVVVFADGEDFLVGKKVNLGSALLGGASLLQLRRRFTLGVALLPDGTVAPDLEL